jgi:integrase
MAQDLTKAAKTAPPPTDGKPYAITYDTKARGLGLRVTKAGHRAWIFNYRTLTGIERRQTIGDLADWPPQRAREEARRLRRLVDQGADPLAERRDRREAPTVTDLVEYWRNLVAPKKRAATRAEYEGMIKQWVIPALGNRKVAEVTHADILRVHGKISRTAPVRANRVVAFLSTLLNIAASDALKWRTDNPAAKIAKNHESPRQRYLKNDELPRLVEALKSHRNQQTANAIRLLLLTGARRGEVLSATWGQFDLVTGVWTKPAATTKQAREHAVQLSAPALLLLSEIRPIAAPDDDHVFAGKNGHLVELKASWRAICRSASISGVRLHDLRHSFASIAASSGASLPLIGALLGHTQSSTTQRYAHLFDEAQRAVAERVGAIVEAAGDGDRRGGAIAPLRGARQ